MRVYVTGSIEVETVSHLHFAIREIITSYFKYFEVDNINIETVYLSMFLLFPPFSTVQSYFPLLTAILPDKPISILTGCKLGP